MIDFTKILIKNIDVERLKNLSELNFKVEVSEKTGELSNKTIAEYHHCKIMIFSNGNVYFSGSIHKLYNSLKGIKAPNYLKQLSDTKQIQDKNKKTELIQSIKDNYKGFNGNIFTLNNVLEVREHLCNLFDCKPQQMEFLNIEFGINTEVEFNPQIFLKGLLFHNGISFEYRFSRCYAQAKHDDYFIKIYNKGLQYGMNNNILRFELKLIRTREIIKTGIKTFTDINTETLTKAKTLLLKRLDEVVYYDNTISKETLTEKVQNTLNRYSNIIYWLDELKPKRRHYHKNILNYFIMNYSNNLKKQIRQEIIKKCIIINRINEDKKCVIIPRLPEQKNTPQKKEKFGIIPRLSEKGKFGIIQTSNIGGIIPNSDPKKQLKTSLKKTDKKRINFNDNSDAKKLCKVTGLRLDLEDEKAKYIRTTTLRYLQKNEKLIFESLVNDLLSRSKKRPKWENNLIKHLAKQIKNKCYNSFNYKPKRNFKVDERQILLFG